MPRVVASSAAVFGDVRSDQTRYFDLPSPFPRRHRSAPGVWSALPVGLTPPMRVELVSPSTLPAGSLSRQRDAVVAPIAGRLMRFRNLQFSIKRLCDLVTVGRDRPASSATSRSLAP